MRYAVWNDDLQAWCKASDPTTACLDAVTMSQVAADVWWPVPQSDLVPDPTLIACMDEDGNTLRIEDMRIGGKWHVRSPIDLANVVVLVSG